METMNTSKPNAKEKAREVPVEREGQPTGVPGDYHEYMGNASMSEKNPYKGIPALGHTDTKPAQ
jgi:hypothetical protein